MGRDQKQMIRQELKEIYKAPEPAKKRQFIEQYKKRKEERTVRTVSHTGKEEAGGRDETFSWEPLSVFHMLAVQCTYLTKWVWVVTAAVLALSFYAGTRLPSENWWVACACVPFLGMTAITAGFRSQTWGMAELEQASRFSLRSIVAARIGILGTGNLLCLFVLCLRPDTAGGRQMLFLLVPYLFTSFGCLAVTRRLKGREGIYASAGVASVVSCMEVVLHGIFAWMTEVRYTGWWLAAAGVMLALAVREFGKTMTRMEELSWN